MNYEVFDPVPDLQPFIKCFWTLDDERHDEPVKQRIVPDGCMEMIFHYGDLYNQFFPDGSFITQPRSFIFGQITSYIEIAPSGVSGIVAARFRPDGLAPFLSVPVSSLDNQAISLEIIFGEKGISLEEQVVAAANNLERIKIIESFMLNGLAERNTIDRITKACVEEIFHASGQQDMDTLASKLNINRRSIERKFNAGIGISPKQLSKLVRLQAALKMLERKRFDSLTELAHESGYYDQAHFIKDFKEITGVIPKAFFSDNLKLSALFIAS